MLQTTQSTVSYPVFYDKTGKRLKRFVALCFVALFALGSTVFGIAPMAYAPTHSVLFHNEHGYARQIVAEAHGKPFPIVGDSEHGIFNRVVRIIRSHDKAYLVDVFSDELYREATEEERQTIGMRDYAIDNFGRPPDRTLMLTFDDGPDALYTPELLDLLSREGVPATFFVLGKSVAKNPNVLQRIVREGHMVGNHSLTHGDFDKQSDFRNRLELISTDRSIRAAAGYESSLFRIPRSNPHDKPLSLLQSQQLGYLHADLDVDSNDWRYQIGEEIPVPKLDGKGHVVLLHDSGGDRSETIRMVERLIKEAKDQGYVFTTMAPLIPTQFQPKKEVSPSIGDHATLFTMRVAWVYPGKLIAALTWFALVTVSFTSFIYLCLAFVGKHQQRKALWPPCVMAKLPRISVVVSAFKEEKVMCKTLNALMKSDYPEHFMEVVAVNDGSPDKTLKILRRYEKFWPLLRVIDQPNSGKSVAMRRAIEAADPASTVIVTIDADTTLQPDALRMMVRHFAKGTHSKRIGAVAGYIRVGNRRNILTAWQSLEYISGICVTRVAEGAVSAISIVPGACSAWDRAALNKIGGFSRETMAEDADAALQLQRLGYRIVQENKAIADTEAPEKIRGLATQRKRWAFGIIQVLWKHRGMMFRPRYGVLGMVLLPYACISFLVPLIFLPFTIIAAALSIADGSWSGILLFSGIMALQNLITAIAGIIIAEENPKHLLVVPIYRIIYEPLRTFLLCVSAYRIVKGAECTWGHVERTNHVNVRVAA